MTVKAILSAKGTEVLTIEPTTNVAAAARLLAERKIGALVVTGPDQRVVGIVSERDIVQELAAHGPAAVFVNDTVAVAQPVAQRVVQLDAHHGIAEDDDFPQDHIWLIAP